MGTTSYKEPLPPPPSSVYSDGQKCECNRCGGKMKRTRFYWLTNKRKCENKECKPVDEIKELLESNKTLEKQNKLLKDRLQEMQSRDPRYKATLKNQEIPSLPIRFKQESKIISLEDSVQVISLDGETLAYFDKKELESLTKSY